MTNYNTTSAPFSKEVDIDELIALSNAERGVVVSSLAASSSVTPAKNIQKEEQPRIREIDEEEQKRNIPTTTETGSIGSPSQSLPPLVMSTPIPSTPPPLPPNAPPPTTINSTTASILSFSSPTMRKNSQRGLTANFKTVELPKDVYSILYLSTAFSWPFWYSLIFFSIQASILLLCFIDLIADDPGNKDNNHWNVPPDVTTAVYVAQYLALLVAVLSQDDVTTSLFFISIGLGPRYPEIQSKLQKKYPGKGSATFTRYWFSNLLRFIEGGVTILISFVFIIQSDNVLDIFLNFAAVQFVSDLDNLGFRLAQEGWFGEPLQVLSKQISEEKIPIKKEKSFIDYFNQIVLFLVVAVLFCMNGVTVHHQKTGDYIERDACSIVNVRFGGDDVYTFPPNTTLNTSMEKDGSYRLSGSKRLVKNPSKQLPHLHYSYFSGKYQAEFNTKAGIETKRPVYYEASRLIDGDSADHHDIKDSSVSFFYYCREENAWVWTVRAFLDAGNIIPPKTKERCEYGWLMKSPITKAVTLDEVPTRGWKVWTGTLDDASDLSVSCLECRDEFDCGLNGGTCEEKTKLCKCNNNTAGDFCTEKYPCNQLIGFDDTGEYGIFDVDSSFSYGRPVYTFTQPSINFTEVLEYRGSQWIASMIPNTDAVAAGLQQGTISADRHAYWSSVSLDSSQYKYYYSEPTNSFLPTGSLQWYEVDETRSEGDYGPRGRELPVKRKYSCWSLDCSVSSGLCGNYGECSASEYLTFKNERQNSKGGKCICKVGYFGHFCEFNLAAEDEL